MRPKCTSRLSGRCATRFREIDIAEEYGIGDKADELILDILLEAHGASQRVSISQSHDTYPLSLSSEHRYFFNCTSDHLTLF